MIAQKPIANLQLYASLVMSVGSQYVCFYVKLKLICANLRIILHFQTGAAAAHTSGLPARSTGQEICGGRDAAQGI